MTKKPKNIDTSAERVHKNPISDLMREAAEYIDSGTLDSDQVSPVYHELRQAAHDIERQDPVAEVQEHPYGHKSAWLVKTAPPENFYVGMKLYAHPQPASDVSALVEALSALRGCIMDTRGPDAHSALVLADAALAAHRKQGGKV